ncbi:hypothetical protein N9100_02715, partial [Gammaproteobacteria bacterium]|nr:hypothetical protein [Gammaproteobacteria bacterium]
MSAETAQTPENTSELFFQKIADIQQEAKANRSNLEAAEGESRSAIILQLLADEEELRSVLGDVLGHVEMLKEDGQETNALIPRIKSVLTEQSNTLYQDIEAAGRRLAKINEIDHSEATADELEQLSRQVAAINDFLDGMHMVAYENIERQKALDLNPAADVKKLKSVLQNRVEKLAGY